MDAASGISDQAGLLDELRGAVAALERGDQAGFEQRFHQLLARRDRGIYDSLGRLTRELHRAVRELRYDERLNQLTATELPEACDRLDYVVKYSEDAAHKTLDLVERSRLLTDDLKITATDIGELRERYLRDSEAVGAPSNLAEALLQSQLAVHRNADLLRRQLTQLAQTQEYQDLTGQIIKRVIALVRNVESGLIDLLRAAGGVVRPTAAPAIPPGLQGPAVPGLVAAANQSDADDLLASLGLV